MLYININLENFNLSQILSSFKKNCVQMEKDDTDLYVFKDSGAGGHNGVKKDTVLFMRII